ncbi:hypothetical protein QZH41_002184 [Actinostola sp. cb2023]|nr:hypothetical protein QZH41_002184 [Actinostola sp. cb2023]
MNEGKGKETYVEQILAWQTVLQDEQFMRLCSEFYLTSAVWLYKALDATTAQIIHFVDCCAMIMSSKGFVPGPMVSSKIVTALLAFADSCSRNKSGVEGGLTAAVVVSPVIREKLASALIQTYTSVDVVEGLDVDKEEFDKFTCRYLSSTRSTVSAKARAMAKKAALEAKAASLKSLHALQTEELEIHQKRAELELQTEISAAEAEKRVYDQAEAEETAEFAHLPNVNFSSTPLERQTTGNPVTEPVPTHSENQPAFSAPLPPNQTPLSSKPKTTLNPRTTAWHYEATPINQSSTLQEELFTRLMENQDRQSHALQQLVQQQQQSVTALTLPQPSLQVFNGDPVECSDFVRAFEQLIEMKTQSPSTRLYYLVQYTTGHVQELMRSCLSMREEEGYLEAKRLLKERFGQGYRIAAALVEKLTDGPTIKSEDATALQKFSTQLTSCSNTLREIGFATKLDSQDSLKRIVDRLPYRLRLRWREVVDGIIDR